MSPRPTVQVQKTIGVSDYVRRDMALKNLIQPLAGEYGMHNNQPQRECCTQLEASMTCIILELLLQARLLSYIAHLRR